jgi:hypothetical protein
MPEDLQGFWGVVEWNLPAPLAPFRGALGIDDLAVLSDVSDNVFFNYMALNDFYTVFHHNKGQIIADCL